MKEYLWEVVKNTGMFIAGVSVIILYGVGLVLSTCIALLPMFIGIFLNDCMGFDKWTVFLPGLVITIPWAVAWFTLLSKIDAKFNLGIF